MTDIMKTMVNTSRHKLTSEDDLSLNILYSGGQFLQRADTIVQVGVDGIDPTL